MARDLRDTHRAAPPPRPGFSRRASRALPHPQGKPLAAAKASPSFAPGPAPPASRLDPPSIATPPKPEPPLAQIFQSIVRDKRRADRLLHPAAIVPEWAFLSPGVPAILSVKHGASIILHHCRHQSCRKILRQPVPCGVLLLKKTCKCSGVNLAGARIHHRGDFVFVPKQKVVRVIQNLPGLALFKRDL